MRWIVDLLYLVIAVVTMPVWLIRMAATGKLRTDWPGRFGVTGEVITRHPGGTLLLHCVSVGEVNAVRELVRMLEVDAPALTIVISSTTNTGFARAEALFGDRHTVVRYPFDLSVSVGRFLDAVRPDVVALIELEVWPNFVSQCVRRHIPVGVINGRLSERSFRRYRRIRPLLKRTFGRLSFVCTQQEVYAGRFRALGVVPDRVTVTGTMKLDMASIESNPERASALASALGVDRDRPIIVAGSTAPEEHTLIRDAVPEGAQLICAPRRPEWFDDAAEVLHGCVRRSLNEHTSATDRYLLDTIGELRDAYELADLVIIGRSFGERHGSDMMEPIGLGKPVVIGPAVADFRDTCEQLLEVDGIMQVDASLLASVVRDLMNDPSRREELAANGRRWIEANQGASARHASLLLRYLSRR